MQKKIEKKIVELLKEYGKSIVKNSSDMYIYPNIPSKKIDNAIKSYAQCLRPNDILALYDDTAFGSAKDGFIIAKKGIWYKNFMEKPIFFLYPQLEGADLDLDDKLVLDFDFDPHSAYIEYLEQLSKEANEIGDDRESIRLSIEITKASSELISNMCKSFDDSLMDKTINGVHHERMEEFLNEIIDFVSDLNNEYSDNYDEDIDDVEKIVGQNRNLGNINTLKSEENDKNEISTIYTNAVNATHLENDAQFQKYHNERGGHGFAAEDANALNDILHGRKVEKVGLNNELDGPDRIVDGIKIQTKYCETPSKTLNAALDKQGRFRYDGQLLEVPKDQYEEVCKLVNEKIEKGELLGNDGSPLNCKAEDIVKEGSITYKQAKNIAKAGNIDSITFDVKNQIITTGCIMGASIIFSTALNMWHGKKNFSEAAQEALFESFKSGSSSMLVGVISAQALRTKTAASGTIIVRPAIKWMYKTDLGKVAIENIAKISLGNSVHGAAAVNHVSKLLRSNIITGGVTVAIMTAPGFYRSLFERSQSWSQFFKDLSVAISGMLGGVGGWMAGASVGGTIGSAVPIIGTSVGATIGGILGAMGGGMGASVAGKKIADSVVDDDSVSIWNDIRDALEELATDYLLTEDEINNQLLSHVKFVSTVDWLRTIYKQGQSSILRRRFIYTSLEHFCEGILEDRKELHISLEDLEEEGSKFISKANEAIGAAQGTGSLLDESKELEGVSKKVKSFWEEQAEKETGISMP